MTDERNLWGPGPDEITPPTQAEIEIALERVVHTGERTIRRRRVIAGGTTAAVFALLVSVIAVSDRPSSDSNQVAGGGTSTSAASSTTQPIGIGVTSTTKANVEPPARLIASVGSGQDAKIVSLDPRTGKPKATIFELRNSPEFNSCDGTFLDNALFENLRFGHLSDDIYFTSYATCNHAEGALFRINADGSNLRLVSTKVTGQFALSPDDTHVAYFTFGDASTSLVVLGIETDTLRVVDNDVMPTGIDWKESGDTLVYTVPKTQFANQVVTASAYAAKLERTPVPQPAESVTSTTTEGTLISDSNPQFVAGGNVYFERTVFNAEGTIQKSVVGVFNMDGNLVTQIAIGKSDRIRNTLTVDRTGRHFLFLSYPSGTEGEGANPAELKLSLNGAATISAGSDFFAAAW